MQSGIVHQIFIASEAGAPMEEVREVRAIEQLGLEGDRYAGEKGAFSKSKRPVIRQVSLIEKEAIDRASGFLPQDTRRNIVVSNFPLNTFVGKEFMLGEVRMRGVELCDPCQRPSKLSGKPGFEERFHNFGGLRAEILNTGLIRAGDRVTAVTYSCLLCGTTTLFPHVCPVFIGDVRREK